MNSLPLSTVVIYYMRIFSQIAFRNMIVPLPKSQTRHRACDRAPLLPRVCRAALSETVLQSSQ